MGLRGLGAKVIKLPPLRREYKLKIRGKNLAERVISFIESLPITSGLLAGKTYKLDKWQRKIINGIYREEKKQRIVRTALVSTPRKQGKTALTSCLALAHLCGPVAEERGQVYSAAADRNQAALIYREMKAILQQVPELRKRVIVRDFNKHLEDVITGSTYFALSADAKTKHGFSASCVIYDELAQAPNRELYDVLSSSGGARKSPLTIVISTQSPDAESIMSELVDYGTRVLSGDYDPSFYPVILSAPDNADPWNEKTWLACNPAIKSGFRDIEEIRTAALQAQRIPAREAMFRLLYLNQRVNTEERFCNMVEWDNCAGTIDAEALRGKRCYAGLDLASTRDVAALVLVFPEPVAAVLPFFWIPEDMTGRSGTEKALMQNWVSRGLVRATHGNVIEYDEILAQLIQCRRDYDLKLLAFDDWGSTILINDLCKEGGFTVDDREAERNDKPLLKKVRQGFKQLSAPTKDLLSAISARKINHGGHPVLRSMANGAKLLLDTSGNCKPVKSSPSSRIDGILALIMAYDAAKVDASKETGFYGDQRELLVL